MRIIFYNETLMSGGIEKCIELLANYLSKENEIEILYIDDTKKDQKIIDDLSKIAYVHRLEKGEVIEADVCIWCRIYLNAEIYQNQIRAKKNILWIHSKPYALENCILHEQKFMNKIDKIVCVSEAVKKETCIQSRIMVIHNFYDENILRLAQKENPFYNIQGDILKLTIVSRLSAEKGFDRVLELVKCLKNNEIRFVLKIVGKGRRMEPIIKKSFDEFEEVEFVGYKENPYPYEKNADYTLVLSPYESYGNVIMESKILGTPCVVTDFSSAREQIEDGINGILVPIECLDYSEIIERMIKQKSTLRYNLKDFKFNNEIEAWKKIIY